MTIRGRNNALTVAGSSRQRRATIAGIVAGSSRAVVTPRIARASMAYGVALAAVQALGKDATDEERASAKRRRRDTRHRLRALVGCDTAERFTAALQMDGGLYLKALHHAPDDVREHALSAALNGAQTAIEHGIGSRAALVLLTRSSVWSGLASAYQHASLRAGGDETLDKRAALAGQQSRLDLMAAMELARMPMVPRVEPARDFAKERAELEAGWAAQAEAPPSPFATAAGGNVVDE